MSPSIPSETFSSFVRGGRDPTEPTLTARIPAVLQPVRLESRLRQESDGLYLWLRIYPDQFHIHSHELELTADRKSVV